MKIIIQTGNRRFGIPAPLGLVGPVLRLMPASALEGRGKGLPGACRPLVGKKALCLLWKELRRILREYRGMEVIRVETKDGTLVSVLL